MSQRLGHGLGLTHRRTPGAGGGAGAAAEITVNAVHFDGTNDVLDRNGALTGATDNKLALVSIWFFFQDDVAAAQTCYRHGASNQLLFFRQADLKLQIRFRSAASGSVWDIITTDTFATSGGWHHCLISVDATNTVTQIYIDDIVPGLDTNTFVDRTIQWNTTNEFTVGADADVPTNPANVYLAELYITNEFLDLNIVANRRRFISTGGKPVDLGSDGSDPTGTAPLIYLSGATATWHTNDGSGGGFDEVGAITDAASSPSD